MVNDLQFSFKIYNKISETSKRRHPYPSPTGTNTVYCPADFYCTSEETKCPCERRDFTKLTFLHPNRHEISIAQDRDRASMKRKRQEDEYTRKTENTKRNDMNRKLLRRLSRPGYSGDADQNFR